MRKVPIIMLLLVCLAGLAPAPARAAAPTATVSADTASLNFPETVTFKAHLQSDKKITSVELEYGNVQLTCGEVIARAFPRFTPASQLDVEWTWEMRQSGSLPPGTVIWWRWHFTDESGTETVGERQTVKWLDTTHPWQTVTAPNLAVHWYRGDKEFAGQILQAAVAGLALNEKSAGLKSDGTIDLYIYGDTDDMREAILYEPSWTGGVAFPEYNIVIIGIRPDELEWGRKTVAHELTHVLVGHLTFSCLGSVPTWLNEGLAVHSEGELDPASQSQLDDAIRDNSLMPVRALSAGFSEVADKALLSYSESYSITKFLIDGYGQPKMTALLTGLRDGATVDEALQQVYGFNVEGLEDAWRAGIGAQARAVAPNATATPAPTFVPTIVPVSGGQLPVSPTPFEIPASPTPPPGPAAPGGATRTGLLAYSVIALCCCLLLVVIVAVVIFVVARRKGGNNA